jgi:hypothetical protein
MTEHKEVKGKREEKDFKNKGGGGYRGGRGSERRDQPQYKQNEESNDRDYR